MCCDEGCFDFDFGNLGIDVVVELSFDFVTLVDFDLRYFDFDEGTPDLDVGIFGVVI